MSTARSIAIVATMLGCGAAAQSKSNETRKPEIAPITVVDDEDAVPSASAHAADTAPTVTGLIVPIAVSGTPVVLTGNAILPGGPIDFDLNSAKLQPSSDAALIGVWEFLRANPTIDDFLVVDELDSPGDPIYALKLTSERARTIRVWLEQHGVGKTKVRERGLGSYCAMTAWVPPNRVKFFVVSMGGQQVAMGCGCVNAAQHGAPCP